MVFLNQPLKPFPPSRQAQLVHVHSLRLIRDH